MKKEIHPNLFETEVHCQCGSGIVWKTISTKERISVEICSQCHPAWTGEQRIVDTEGRVERMNRRYNLK